MADPRDDARRQPRGLRATDASADASEPVDLSALQADDALLDALGSGDPRLTAPMSDHQLNALLLAWRDEVDAEPVGQLVDTDTAVRIITGTEARPATLRHRFLVPLTSAAAVLVLAFIVIGFAARTAQPGDTLWGVTQVLYSEHAKSVQAASTARRDLDHARQLMRDGDPNGAWAILNRLGPSLDAVQGEDGKDLLAAARAQLLDQLQHPGAPVPGRPPSGAPPATSGKPPTRPGGSGTPSRGENSTVTATHLPPPDNTTAPDTDPTTAPSLPSTPPTSGPGTGTGTPPGSSAPGGHAPTAGGGTDDPTTTTSPPPS